MLDLSFVPNILSRVHSSAKLSKVSASVIERRVMENSWKAKFSKFVDDCFEKNGILTKEEIQNFYKQQIPTIDVEVISSKRGGLGYKYTDDSEQAIKGYFVKVPFSNGKNVIYSDDCISSSILKHENGHLTRAIFEPKYSIISVPGRLSEKQNNEQCIFFNSLIYNNELSDLPFSKKKDLTSNKTLRREFIKDSIDNFFLQNNFSSEEKIDILEKWRYRLKDELSEVRTETDALVENKFNKKNIEQSIKDNKNVIIPINNELSFFSSNYNTFEEKISALKSFIKKMQSYSYRNFADNQLFLFDKKQIIEKMLLKEITDYRKTMAINRRFQNITNQSKFSKIA